jgi:hypothetical protein
MEEGTWPRFAAAGRAENVGDAMLSRTLMGDSMGGDRGDVSVAVHALAGRSRAARTSGGKRAAYGRRKECTSASCDDKRVTGSKRSKPLKKLNASESTMPVTSEMRAMSCVGENGPGGT